MQSETRPAQHVFGRAALECELLQSVTDQ
jgi:hypothetical protein